MSLSLKPGFSFGGVLQKLYPEENLTRQEIILENSDEYWMAQALSKSMENGCAANPNPSVGCVVVLNNKIISSGCTERWGGKHAERVAFESLKVGDLEGTTVYVTLEPCTHVGKQPPCVELFRNRGISKVVIGSEDPNPIVSGNGIQQLKEMGIECKVGVLKTEVQAWLSPFFIQQRNHRPLIALKWAQSLDGCFADDHDGWQWISGIHSRKYTHWLRQKYDAILIGVGTLLNDFPSLDVREIQNQYKRDPLKIIYDPFGKIFQCTEQEQAILTEKTFKLGTKQIILIGTQVLLDEKEKNNKWFQFLKNNENFILQKINDNSENKMTNIIVESLKCKEIDEFLGRPLQSILIEGGPRLLSLFLQEKNYDVLHVFIAPFFLGGEKNKLFSKKQRALIPYIFRDVSKVERMKIVVQERLGNDILLEMVQEN
ncbi:bifunctional diaminohydroxyphosphoribosylaminopyrimidine deaminase/5-amino-6-(5-phosphoribosylamino)uracil reductase RibD [Fluviispira vulneris]|uniref:bifunctional diaminohydroxyphosphoribosylaminopyrimidine deaminase/5-amino-6-(5-phosphoribosylamino)uracil reductase RibD n=1 Tax=Fluviispira vulneris TaxID=2763012 RepID=UPI0016471C9B|nr:bifunctional diaminohydroxyphosphoribosylaminopyrimidine deaminase/5-amino-6-(5-phosphoribosylamino)uracil reductase RibD [Fluviispira vulneris]